MLTMACKEWAVICRALAQGRQSLLLRKGGIAEPAGRFTVEHSQFWLYPTFVHQQEEGIQEEAFPLLQEVKSSRPAPGKVRLTHWAEVTGIYHVRSLTSALLLSHLHLWSEETVAKRFHYREPGLFVLTTRAHRAAQAFDLAETERYLGCKSWVELEEGLSTQGSTPVLDDTAFNDVKMSLDLLLQPTALA